MSEKPKIPTDKTNKIHMLLKDKHWNQNVLRFSCDIQTDNRNKVNP